MPIDPKMVKWQDAPIDESKVEWDTAKEKPVETSFLERQRNGLATAPINAYLGVKQFFGGLDPIEQNILAQNKAAEKDAPVASLVSNVGMLAPTLFIPGANTITGAGVVSAANGLIQPVEGDQTLGNIAKGKTINTAIGGAVGAAGQFGANKAADFFTKKLADKTAEMTAAQTRNSMRDAVLKEGQSAGYVVPQSQVQPTFLSNRLESIGGKAAVKQEATVRNQEVTNALTRKALGLSEDFPISQTALDGIRKTSGKAYQEVASLNPQAAADLEALKVARNEATGWFTAYNRSARPDDLAKAKAARELSDQLEKMLETHAKQAGREELIPALVSARKQIAKTYTVERALNKSTGEVSAPVLGRMLDKGKPLSDGLDTIAKFNQAFPQVSRPAAMTQTPGVSFAEPLTAGMAGLAGQALTGNPLGLMAAGLPLLRGPARSLALSKGAAQNYGVGALTRGGAKLSPELLGLLARSGLPLTGGLLAAE